MDYVRLACEGSLSRVDDPFFLTHGELRDTIAYITSR
jgi:hypothetical protein